jgi:hypothetical protein
LSKNSLHAKHSKNAQDSLQSNPRQRFTKRLLELSKENTLVHQKTVGILKKMKILKNLLKLQIIQAFLHLEHGIEVEGNN